MKVAATRDVAAPYRLAVYIACTLVALVANYLLGKDMAFDTLTYHLYAGFSAVNDRFAQDYFPAGPNSYFNPYVYVPLYYLVKSGLSSLEISSALVLVHSVMLWLTYELALTVCPSHDARQRLIFGLCAVAFALINPILLQQIGSTFADITSGELVLAGWLLLALAVRTPSIARVIGAGLLCGIATGLKLTNAVHAIAAFALLILLPLPAGGRIRQGLVYGISLGLGFLVVAAPWSYRLERRFGNPLFPLLNNVFRSPEFTTEPSPSPAFRSGNVCRGSVAAVRHGRSCNDGARRASSSGSAIRPPIAAGCRLFLPVVVAASRAVFKPTDAPPRCGFRARLDGDQLRPRGGLGVLAERIPAIAAIFCRCRVSPRWCSWRCCIACSQRSREPATTFSQPFLGSRAYSCGWARTSRWNADSLG